MYQELELYIHIPFCVKKCAYCDFLSGPADHERKRKYLDALLEEVQGYKKIQPISDYIVTSIFFGGGTPSIFPGEWICEIMDAVKQTFSLTSDAEITIEANPGTVDEEKLHLYKKAGINRISFGCQSADNEELKMLGRIHTWETFLDSYAMARTCGFDNINVDLMSGLPGQTVSSWEQTLEKVIRLEPEHISAYSLIVEEGTPFYEMADKLNLPDEDAERTMYERTGEILKKHGYEQYEISNYARAGYACQHNIGYWTGRAYLGLGLGSSSLFEEKRFSNTGDMEEYLEESGQIEELRRDVMILTKENQMEEFMILGLRMNQGVSEVEFEKQFKTSIDTVYGEILNKYEQSGHLQRKQGQISFTRKGISVSNPILAEMLL